MPIKRDSSHLGCLVRGLWMKPNGSPATGEVSIVPSHSGFYNGVYYQAVPIGAPVSSTGEFVVCLPPSSILGPYKFDLGGVVFTIDVPDQAEADFAGLAHA